MNDKNYKEDAEKVGNVHPGFSVVTTKKFICPTEEQVLKTIFDNVFIRGIQLEEYTPNFKSNGLFEKLNKLFYKTFDSE